MTIGCTMLPDTVPLEILDKLTPRVEACMLGDRPRLRELLRRARRAARASRPNSRIAERLRDELERSESRSHARRQDSPTIHYPPDLPVSQERETIREAIRDNQVVVVCGETGSGKTTQLPKICLELGRGVVGTIAHTQPRRLAARSVARRIAQELGTPLGSLVGVKMRFADETSDRTRIKLVTDGLLLAETQSDHKLLRYDTIIIDEAHERSLNIDFLLGYCKRLLAQRPELKLIITSATIDPERFSEHFDGAPIINVSGKTYPVEMRYTPPQMDDNDEPDVDRAIRDALEEIFATGPGDVLVFFSGEREIRDTADWLRELGSIHHEAFDVLPLYARLSMDEQGRVFQPSKRRRIVLATNVAETSVTVPGIRYVIDPGYARISRYGTRTRVHRLPIEPISRASANQRSGRCGRLGPGICYRLYSREDHEARPEFTDPEIMRTNLAGVILQMKALRLGDIKRFPFLDPPEHRALRDGLDSLRELGAIDDEDELTAIGHDLARLPLDPRLGRMLHAAQGEGSLREALIVCSMLSIQDPRERPMDKRSEADIAHKRWENPESDFLTVLALWDDYHERLRDRSRKQVRAWCQASFLSYPRMRDWIETHRQLRDIVSEQGWAINTDECPPNALHRALLTGMLASVGRKTDGFEYEGVRATRFHIHPGSGLFSERPQWVMSAELVRTTRLYARMVASIQARWIDRVAPHVVKRRYSDAHYDATRGQVMAHETVTLWGLPVVERRKVHYGPINPSDSRELFIHHGLVDGEHRSGKWQRHNEQIEDELRKLEAKSRRTDILSQTGAKYDFFDARVPEDVYTSKAFEHWRTQAERTTPTVLYMDRELLLAHEPVEVSERSHPDRLDIDGGRADVEYRLEPGHEDDGVTITVPLERLASLTQTQVDWLVTGLLEERTVERIRSMPKSLRTSFVPAPNYARRVLADLEPSNTPVDEAIARSLERITGTPIPRDAWARDELPLHLRIRVRVVDGQSNTLGVGRDVASLQQELRERIDTGFASLDHDEFNRAGISSWDFDPLPESVPIETDTGTLVGYPALVDEGESAALRLFPERARSERAHREGVRRLCMLRMRGELSYIADTFPNLDRMVLDFAPWGDGATLREHLLMRIVDRVFVEDQETLRDGESFERRIEERWSLTGPTADTVCVLAQTILSSAIRLRAALDESPGGLGECANDLRSQLDSFLFEGFLYKIPWVWFGHLPRYLASMEHRLRRLLEGGRDALESDRQRMGDIRRCVEAYESALSRADDGEIDPELDRFRWMIEEFRVQVFAQHLGTSQPVSAQRLEAQWERVRTR
ncbi:MAG: ATP-dependent RNA helicase HrpA [Phycisphaerales bacterium JB043]